MKPSTYKAAIYQGIGNVEVVDMPYPKCEDDGIIVKNLMAGLCGADVLAYAKGGDPHMIWKGFEFGHEMVSEVVEVGKNVKGIKVGDHLFPNQGNALRDLNRMATVGGFSEYIYIPQCEVDFSVIMIDNDIPLTSAVLLEPFVIGTRGALNLNPGPGKTAVVFGAGIIGMSAAIMLKWFGSDKVMIVDLSDLRLENAKRFDLVTCNPSKEDLKQKAIEEFGEGFGYEGPYCGANLYLDAIGIQPVIDQIQTIAGYGAMIGIVGVHHKPGVVDLLKVCYNNWHINGCGSTSINDAAVEIFKMMRSGKYNLASLISHQYKIDQIKEALTMGGNADEAQKVCISYI